MIFLMNRKNFKLILVFYHHIYWKIIGVVFDYYNFYSTSVLIFLFAHDGKYSRSPKLQEVSDRTKTALMQYLGAVVPYCSLYFNQPTLTSAFLSRMAFILGDSNSSDGSRPSVTLLASGKRLLELVYNSSPMVIYNLAPPEF